MLVGVSSLNISTILSKSSKALFSISLPKSIFLISLFIGILLISMAAVKEAATLVIPWDKGLVSSVISLSTFSYKPVLTVS